MPEAIKAIHARLTQPDCSNQSLRIECWAQFFSGYGFTL